MTHMIAARAVKVEPCCGCQSTVLSEKQIVFACSYPMEVGVEDKVEGGRTRH